MNTKIQVKAKICFALSFLAASLIALNAHAEDIGISFSSTGPDRYSDGSFVMDGEVYALVWSKDGVFDGFRADGQPKDVNDKVVLAAPIAKDKRCPDVLFQVDSKTVAELANGKYAVYLLDTRVSKNNVVAPRGTENGQIKVMNGYGAVASSVTLSSDMRVQIGENQTNGKGHATLTNASAPTTGTQPRILDMRLEGDNVILTVENTGGFMRVQGGDDVRTSDQTGAAVETNGDKSEPVLLIAPKRGDKGFYRVIGN